MISSALLTRPALVISPPWPICDVRGLLGPALADCERRGHVRVVLSPSPRSVPFCTRAGFTSADELMVWRPTRT